MKWILRAIYRDREDGAAYGRILPSSGDDQRYSESEHQGGPQTG